MNKMNNETDALLDSINDSMLNFSKHNLLNSSSSSIKLKADNKQEYISYKISLYESLFANKDAEAIKLNLKNISNSLADIVSKNNKFINANVKNISNLRSLDKSLLSKINSKLKNNKLKVEVFSLLKVKLVAMQSKLSS